jgi:hypothetical protein
MLSRVEKVLRELRRNEEFFPALDEAFVKTFTNGQPYFGFCAIHLGRVEMAISSGNGTFDQLDCVTIKDVGWAALVQSSSSAKRQLYPERYYSQFFASPEGPKLDCSLTTGTSVPSFNFIVDIAVLCTLHVEKRPWLPLRWPLYTTPLPPGTGEHLCGTGEHLCGTGMSIL